MNESFLAHVGRDDQGRSTIRLHGELDLAETDMLASVLDDAVGSTVIVDLADLSFIDATGLSALAAAKWRAHADGRRLLIRGARGFVRTVFQLGDLEDLLTE
ncbi:MAG: STAS domain-containing protein [Acidimicrobiales bacterium]